MFPERKLLSPPSTRRTAAHDHGGQDLRTGIGLGRAIPRVGACRLIQTSVGNSDALGGRDTPTPT